MAAISRLLNCTIAFEYGEEQLEAWKKMLVAEETMLWWDVKKLKHTRYLFNGKITLSQKFF